jgi:hypothetical protein
MNSSYSFYENGNCTMTVQTIQGCIEVATTIVETGDELLAFSGKIVATDREHVRNLRNGDYVSVTKHGPILQIVKQKNGPLIEKSKQPSEDLSE